MTAPAAGEERSRGWPLSADGVDRIRSALSDQGGHTAEAQLLGSDIVDSGYVGSGVNETQWVKFPDGSLAYFKSVNESNTSVARNYGHTDPAEGALHEIAAWRVAKVMGPPWSALVPVCVMREVTGELGSLAAGVKGAHYPPKVESEACHRAAVFDALIGSQDRHPGNFMGYRFDQPADALDLALIDNGFGFGVPGDRLNHSVFVAACAGEPLDQVDRDAISRLLESTNLIMVRDLLRPDRAAALQARGTEMLHTGKILAERGSGSAGMTKNKSWEDSTW